MDRIPNLLELADDDLATRKQQAHQPFLGYSRKSQIPLFDTLAADDPTNYPSCTTDDLFAPGIVLSFDCHSCFLHFVVDRDKNLVNAEERPHTTTSATE